jgi:hypothetical protein
MKKCKLCKKEITNSEFEFCPYCGGDWKGGLTRDKCWWDRNNIIPKLEEARDNAKDKEDYEYIDGIIEGINWSFDYCNTYKVVNILEKKYGININ